MDRQQCEAAESKEHILDLNRIVADLKNEKGRLERAIAALEESASPRVAAKKLSVTAQQPAASNGKKRGAMTPEGRRRLSLAMKKRWAERKKKGS
jgi:exonuclease VII small subunit